MATETTGDMGRFGEKLRWLRTHHGMTLKELACALGYTAHGHISEIESGQKKPTAEFVLKLSRLWGTTTDQLLKDELELGPTSAVADEEVTVSGLAFVEREPTKNEVERLRLVLSTYQDGSGQISLVGRQTLPGWRDFERSVALVFGGIAQESKAIFDVLLPDPQKDGTYYGISCKMRRTLLAVRRTKCVTIEVSNSSAKFWDALGKAGLNQQTYGTNPPLVGKTLIHLVGQWHRAASAPDNGNVDTARSFYLVLQWEERSLNYRLFRFPLDLVEPDALQWTLEGKRIVGRDGRVIVCEWYGAAGGQLKYYPRVEQATWSSEEFQLQPLPNSLQSYGVLNKAKTYFPNLWP